MRCLSCHKLSFSAFCQVCQSRLLQPTIAKRVLNGFEVYSFYHYQHIEDLLLTKHTPQGYIIYNALARIVFKKFIKNFIRYDKREIYIVGIDENIKFGYSHVALLTHQMRQPNVKVLHAKLLAKNAISYAGKNLQFRLENPRNFKYTGKKNIQVILVDDLITTGSTMLEAKEILEKNNCEVIFGLTLSDANINIY